jgi:Derlin-2/3
VLKTPQFLKTLLDPHPEDADYAPMPEERPGGFDWGNQQQPADEARRDQ